MTSDKSVEKSAPETAEESTRDQGGNPPRKPGRKAPQSMKPATAAKKLEVYLEATPEAFREGVVTRDELNALQADPPEWLRDLRRDGPHPRPVVAAKLGVSISGLTRGGVTEPLTTAQIEALKADPPEWLHSERSIQGEVRREAVRVKEKQAKELRAQERKAAEERAALARENAGRRPSGGRGQARRTAGGRGR